MPRGDKGESARWMARYSRWEHTRYGKWTANVTMHLMWCPPLFWVAYWFFQRVTGRWRMRWVEGEK